MGDSDEAKRRRKEYEARWREDNKEKVRSYSRKWQKRAVAEGRCENCGAPRGERSTPTLCAGCRDKERERGRRRREQQKAALGVEAFNALWAKRKRDWRLRNVERANEWAAAWRSKNRGRVREINAAYRERHPERMREKDHRQKSRRRAVKMGVAADPVDRHVVFARDGWRCQICGKRTPKRLLGTNKERAPTLDHRVPLALGGAHSYENTQTACRACNSAKGARSCAGQLRMF